MLSAGGKRAVTRGKRSLGVSRKRQARKDQIEAGKKKKEKKEKKRGEGGPLIRPRNPREKSLRVKIGRANAFCISGRKSRDSKPSKKRARTPRPLTETRKKKRAGRDLKMS